MSSQRKRRLKRKAPTIPPAALATVAVGAAPVGRQASECGMRKWVGSLGRKTIMSNREIARTGR